MLHKDIVNNKNVGSIDQLLAIQSDHIIILPDSGSLNRIELEKIIRSNTFSTIRSNAAELQIMSILIRRIIIIYNL